MQAAAAGMHCAAELVLQRLAELACVEACAFTAAALSCFGNGGGWQVYADARL